MVDGFFFPDEPLDLLTEKSFNSVPSVIGVNNHECGFLLPKVRIPAVLPVAPSAVRQLRASKLSAPIHDTKRCEGDQQPRTQRCPFPSRKEGNCGLGAAVANVRPALRLRLREKETTL